MGDQGLPREIQAFLDRVKENPMKYKELILSVRERITFKPHMNVAGRLAYYDKEAHRVLMRQRDPNAVLRAIVKELEGISLVEHFRLGRPEFRQIIETEDILADDFSNAYQKLIFWHRFCHHRPRLIKRKLTSDVDDLVIVQTIEGPKPMRYSTLYRIGQGFVEDPQFRRAFPRLYERIRRSPMSRIHITDLGLELVHAPQCRRRRPSGPLTEPSERLRLRTSTPRELVHNYFHGWPESVPDYRPLPYSKGRLLHSDDGSEFSKKLQLHTSTTKELVHNYLHGRPDTTPIYRPLDLSNERLFYYVPRSEFSNQFRLRTSTPKESVHDFLHKVGTSSASPSPERSQPGRFTTRSRLMSDLDSNLAQWHKIVRA